MSTVVPQSPAPTPTVVQSPTPGQTPERRRWLGRLLILFACGLAVATWFAPLIVAETSLKQQVPKLLFPLYPGAIEVGSASLGWMQPVVVQNLRAEDAEGRPFLDVREFSTVEPLWKLVFRCGNLGRLKFTEPRISIEFRPQGSNVEDIVERMMSGPANSSPTADFELEVVDATVAMEHKLASLSSTVAPVSVILQSRRGAIDDLELTIGKVPSSDEATLEPPTDWLAFRIGNEPTQDGVAMTPGSKHLRLKAEAWTLDQLLPAIARLEPGAELSGSVDADLRSQINFAEVPPDWTNREWSWDGRITVRKFLLAGISALRQDRIELETTSLAGRLASQQGRLSMDRVQLQTEVGELTASGDIPLAGLEVHPLNAVRSILGEQDYTIHGQLDLQRLAALLPNTLRVREGTHVTGGRVDVNLHSEEVDGERRWTADAVIDQLGATNQGQAVAWAEPFKLTMRAHRAQDIITVDQMTCQSDFFKLTGNGTLTDARFNATGDLTRLEDSLQQFIDPGWDKMAGQVKMEGEILRQDDDRIAFTTAIQLDDFQWDISKDLVWREPRLVLAMHAVGDDGLTRTDSADLKLTSGPDTFVASLLQPVDWTDGATWNMKTALDGDLRTWQNRLRPFFSVDGWQFAGIAKVDGTITADPQQVEIVSMSGDVTSLDARGPGWWIKEPQVKLESSGIWSKARNEWTSPQTTLTGTAISCRIDDLVMVLSPDGQLDRITGDAAYRGDLDKLSRWKNQAVKLPTHTLLGTFEGRANLVQQGSEIVADMQTTITKFVVAELQTLPNQQLHWVALWREPNLQIAGKGTYDVGADHLRMDTASMQADGLSLNATGTLAGLSTDQLIDLKGELGYDWQTVSQRMGDSVKKSIQLTGKQTRPISLKGSLASLGSLAGAANSPNGLTDLTGSAGIGWDSAVVEGLAVGPVDVSARLDRGICQFTPIQTTVADGKLQLTPQIRLNTEPALLVLPAEKVIDRVQISPELCNSWLKFVAPLLADATQIDGQFSLDLAGGSLPLAKLTSGELGGALGVHHAKVRPGATALQILSVIDQIKSVIERRPAGNAPRDRIWMQMPEQAISFRMTGGRVHHQNATFSIGDGTVISSGSVGLDETIDLVLQIPIQDDWLKDEKLLSGLKGKSLKVPVRGTLGRPQVDSRVLTELATQIGGTALEGVIENQLDDLFKGKLKKFLPGQN